MANEPLIPLYEARLYYDSNTFIHRANFWMVPDNWAEAPGLGPTEYDIVTKGGVIQSFRTSVDLLIPQIDGLFPATATFQYAELWRYAQNSQNAEYLTTADIDLPGTNAGAVVLAGEFIATARTDSGRVMRLQLEEGVFPVTTPISWNANAGGNVVEQLGDFWIGATMPFCDREGGFPIGLLRYAQGQNEQIFRKRYRNQ